MTVRRGSKRSVTPADVAVKVQAHSYPLEVPFSEWEEETKAYCYLVAGNTDHGFTCETGELAGGSLADWFRAVFATDMGCAPPGKQWIAPREG